MEATASPPPRPVLGWAAMDTPDDGKFVMFVGGVPDEMKFEGDAQTAEMFSDAYGGAWFGAWLDDKAVIAFGVVEFESVDEPPVTWYVADPPAEVLATVLDVPHLVAIIPSDAPGIDTFGRDREATVALLAHATTVETTHQMRSLLSLAPSNTDSHPVDRDDLVDLKDPDAVRAALAPVRSRVARATGELLTDNQLVPMAWRPWHFELIENEYIAGLLWQWPIIQTFFGLTDPAASNMEGIAAPTPEQQHKLRSYLATVARLARSMAVNSSGSVKTRWTRNDGQGPVDVDAPHDDALAALLPMLRQLFDPQEGSGLSFNQLLNTLSTAANTAGLPDLVLELKKWRKAHARLRRSHVDGLRHELAEEVAGESLGSPHRSHAEISSEQLILTFMYGETLHRDHDKAAQIEEWDRDPLLGPLMRQQVRSDARGFVHFYGAFAGFIARWLELTTHDGASAAPTAPGST